MKRVVPVFVLLLLLTGCLGKNQELEKGMELRAKLLSSSCSFDATITADYGDDIYIFSMDCQADSQGNLTFTVAEPETISGISGSLSVTGGNLTFDEAVLAFPMLADGQLTPVSAPWILVKTLQGGYLRSAGMDGDLIRLSIDDSYEADALQLDIWLDSASFPVKADIMYAGRRILSVKVSNFQFM